MARRKKTRDYDTGRMVRQILAHEYPKTLPKAPDLVTYLGDKHSIHVSRATAYKHLLAEKTARAKGKKGPRSPESVEGIITRDLARNIAHDLDAEAVHGKKRRQAAPDAKAVIEQLRDICAHVQLLARQVGFSEVTIPTGENDRITFHF